MKIVIFCFCCILAAALTAQTTISKTYALQAGQHVALKFDYPVVRVSTWDKNEVAVTAHVNINNGDNDSAFALAGKEENGQWVISGLITDINKLPVRYTVLSNGQKMIFRSKAAYLEATKSSAAEKSYEGPDIDIVVEVKVPVQCSTDIQSVYGIVEMIDFNAPVTVNATYGGIDVTINVARTGKLQVTTNYGQIYANLDLKISDHNERDFFSSISAEPGNGPSYSFTSTYGKIYLRKP